MYLHVTINKVFIHYKPFVLGNNKHTYLETSLKNNSKSIYGVSMCQKNKMLMKISQRCSWAGKKAYLSIEETVEDSYNKALMTRNEKTNKRKTAWDGNMLSFLKIDVSLSTEAKDI